jgi:hypothetical protein
MTPSLNCQSIKKIPAEDEPDMLILPENGFAMLINEIQYAFFAEKPGASSTSAKLCIFTPEHAKSPVALGFSHVSKINIKCLKTQLLIQFNDLSEI